MNAILTGTALSLHNLGLAAGFGGSLYGQAALHPAVTAIEDTKERGAILHQAWRNYSPANAFGLAIVSLTWLAGRSAISGGEIDDETRGLVIAKDILVGIYTATGIGSIVVGLQASKNNPPVEVGHEAAAGASEAEAKALKTVGLLGKANIIAAAGIICVTAILNVKAGRSSKWALLSKLLP